MKKYQFHKRWGDKYPIRPEVVDYAYSLIEEPVKQIEYLKYLTKVTEWWDDNDKENIPTVIKRNCKTAADRIKAEQKYKDYLSDHLRGANKTFKVAKFTTFHLRGTKTSKEAKFTMLQLIFFQGRTTGRDLSRVKDIGYFQSYMQRKYIRPKGRPYLLAWYLHHLIDYCHEVYMMFPLTEIINRNRYRIKPSDPEYDEVVSFIQQHWEELKYDFESY